MQRCLSKNHGTPRRCMTMSSSSARVNSTRSMRPRRPSRDVLTHINGVPRLASGRWLREDTGRALVIGRFFSKKERRRSRPFSSIDIAPVTTLSVRDATNDANSLFFCLNQWDKQSVDREIRVMDFDGFARRNFSFTLNLRAPSNLMGQSRSLMLQMVTYCRFLHVKTREKGLLFKNYLIFYHFDSLYIEFSCVLRFRKGLYFLFQALPRTSTYREDGSKQLFVASKISR